MKDLIQMSHQSFRERSNILMASSEALGLGAISEEFLSPTASRGDIEVDVDVKNKSFTSMRPDGCPVTCTCQNDGGGVKFTPVEVEKMLKEKEEKLRAEFEKDAEVRLSMMKEKYDFVLQNEQIRAGFMLREAHRERQEKVLALQKQLECKNMAGLMYVLCSERRKCKLEKLKIVEDYTNYIHNLQDILSEGQRLILHLSRGYKTAARVDQEWRDKMKKVIKEFQEYVYHFAGGSPDTNQYVFDIPALLRAAAPVDVDPGEEPCNCADEETTEPEPEKCWWERLEGDDRPFAVFGDMASFDPPQRRAVLKAVKGAKSAPVKWKEYVFHEMLVKSGCPNQDAIKDLYPERLPADKWECATLNEQDSNDVSRVSSRRYTTTSMDMNNNNNVRAAMGSMLRMITTSNVAQQPSQKANILAARDSMEIASTTRLREKTRESIHGSKCVSISIGGINKETKMSTSRSLPDETVCTRNDVYKARVSNVSGMEVEEEREAPKGLGSIHADSLTVIPGHVPEKDHKINYEKICPVEKCQRMQVDSFTRSLPAYMRDSPFTHFRHSFADYETCTREQLDILRQRIANKANKSRHNLEEDPLHEWSVEVEGVAVQTSELSLPELLPCTCRAPVPSPAPSTGRVYNVEDLIPMKEALDIIKEECFHNERVQFNRFKVIGQEDNVNRATATSYPANKTTNDFKQVRMAEIKKILKQHPSLLDMFQGNTKC